MSDPRRVLVVDDNEINATLAAAYFQREGWTATVADDGARALRLLEEAEFDLVLLDISMPGMSGIDVCRALRADPRWRDTPIVAYTAHAMADERAALEAAGFDDILTKPVGRSAIVAALARLGFVGAGKPADR